MNLSRNVASAFTFSLFLFLFVFCRCVQVALITADASSHSALAAAAARLEADPAYESLRLYCGALPSVLGRWEGAGTLRAEASAPLSVKAARTTRTKR